MYAVKVMSLNIGCCKEPAYIYPSVTKTMALGSADKVEHKSQSRSVVIESQTKYDVNIKLDPSTGEKR